MKRINLEDGLSRRYCLVSAGMLLVYIHMFMERGREFSYFGKVHGYDDAEGGNET